MYKVGQIFWNKSDSTRHFCLKGLVFLSPGYGWPRRVWGRAIGDFEQIRLYMAPIREGWSWIIRGEDWSVQCGGEACFFSMHVELKRGADPRELQTAPYLPCWTPKSLNRPVVAMCVLFDPSGPISKMGEALVLLTLEYCC